MKTIKSFVRDAIENSDHYVVKYLCKPPRNSPKIQPFSDYLRIYRSYYREWEVVEHTTENIEQGRIELLNKSELKEN
jgi:hypothetical protein